jgi:hypothetical protein
LKGRQPSLHFRKNFHSECLKKKVLIVGTHCTDAQKIAIPTRILNRILKNEKKKKRKKEKNKKITLACAGGNDRLGGIHLTSKWA